MKIQSNPKPSNQLDELSEKELILVQKIKSLSDENRKKIKRFVEVIINEDELQIDRNEDGSPFFNAFVQLIVIPLKLLEEECSISSIEETKRLLHKLKQFSNIDFITFENHHAENSEYYTNNLLLTIDNPTILKNILSILDDNAPNIITENKISVFDTNEEIILKFWKIKIKGKTICKGELQPEPVFNLTDQFLIYFLYDEFIKNKEKCFSLEVLSEKIGKKGKYIKNRITEINKKIGLKASTFSAMVKIIFIKYEQKHKGWHLNPKFLK